MKRLAFSMLELIFVIVIMGILGKFGVEFISKAYKNFIYTKINTTLQNNSASAVEFIATRLQYRIKDSIISRQPTGNATDYEALSSVAPDDQSYTILEWIGTDIDGFRGDTVPYWSGVIDIDAPGAGTSVLISPQTNTTSINTLIGILSEGNSSISNAAIYFIGSGSDITQDYGWSGNTLYMQDQNGSMHPINSNGNTNEFIPKANNFSGVDIYEYYKLAWSAYAVSLEHNATNNTDNLFLYSNYQPWEGESYTQATKKDLLMQNVDTFRFMSIGSIVKLQICVKSDIIDGDSTGGYSICKEKTVY